MGESRGPFPWVLIAFWALGATATVAVLVSLSLLVLDLLSP